MSSAEGVNRIAAQLTRDGYVDNEVDARLAAIRIIRAVEAIRGVGPKSAPTEHHGRRPESQDEHGRSAGP